MKNLLRKMLMYVRAPADFGGDNAVLNHWGCQSQIARRS